jgi:hypothetical protein
MPVGAVLRLVSRVSDALVEPLFSPVTLVV